jgi:putative endonuclease
LYKGYTENIERRLIEHNSVGEGKWTSARGPWKLVYTKEFETKKEAMAHERFLKSGKGREYLKSILNGV